MSCYEVQKVVYTNSFWIRFIYLFIYNNSRAPVEGCYMRGVESLIDDSFDGFFEMGDAGVVYDVSRKIVPFR